MRTQYFIAGAIAMVLAASLFYGSGAAAHFNAGDNNVPGQSDVDKAGPDNPDKRKIEANPSTGGSMAGLVVGAGGTIKTIITLVAYWPALLQWLGFPGWFAGPVGVAVEILFLVGIAQFIGGRVLR